MNKFCCNMESPLGRLKLTAGEDGLTGVYFRADVVDPVMNPVLEQAIRWLEKYFSGVPMSPEQLTLTPQGTDFQRKVWALLLRIPYGETMTYSQIAKMISSTMSAQAVGNAVGANPIPIIIPCHRVLAVHGIGGYSDGVAIKKQLLSLEKIPFF